MSIKLVSALAPRTSKRASLGATESTPVVGQYASVHADDYLGSIMDVARCDLDMAYGSANVHPHASLDKRRFARRKVRRSVSVATLAQHRIAATVCDLSPVGCKLVANDRVAVGSFVEVIFDERIRPAGWVAWSRDGTFGVDFDYQLVPAAFEQILIESSPASVDRANAPPFSRLVQASIEALMNTLHSLFDADPYRVQATGYTSFLDAEP